MVVLSALVGALAGYYAGPLRGPVDDLLGIEPVSVSSRWPLTGGCEPNRAVAMARGGKDVRAIPYPLDRDPRLSVIEAGGASWVSGGLGLVVSATEGRSVIVDIDFRVYRRTPSPAVDWVLVQERGGCGGLDLAGQFLRYDLDRSRVVNVDGDAEYDESSPKGPVLRGIRVDYESPLRLGVNVRSCGALYEWGVDIRYTKGGETKTWTVGPPTAPLRSVGGVKDVPRWKIGPERDSQARRLSPLSERTDQLCRVQLAGPEDK